MSQLTLTSISKSFDGTQVLRDISLSIADGEFVTLLGPSGCGKSTLLRVIAGLVTQDAGSIEIGGRPIDHLQPVDRNIAMVFQDYALYPQMTVRQNVALPLLVAGLGPVERLPVMQTLWPRARRVRRQVEAQVAAVAKSLEIDKLLDRRPSQLSGGQQQRVALARAIVRRPHAFLLDEPFSNLDAKLRVQLRAEIAALHRKLAKTFVFVTHDQAEAMTLSDRVAVMRDGKLLQVGTPREIYEQPRSLSVAEFIGSPPVNLFKASAVDGRIRVGRHVLAVSADAPHGSALTLAVRPEATAICDPNADEPGIACTVTRIEYLGAETLISLCPRAPEDIMAMDRDLVVRLPDTAAQRFGVGQSVGIAPAPDRLLLFDRHGARVECSRSETQDGTAARRAPAAHSRLQPNTAEP